MLGQPLGVSLSTELTLPTLATLTLAALAALVGDRKNV